jgi:hypothetical protein
LKVRQQTAGQVDGFRLTVPESATLHGMKNIEEMKVLLEKLTSPHPGERTNLE